MGGGGLILNYDGSAWRSMKSPTGMVLRAVWGASRSDVFAAGSGLLLRYNGRDWRDESDGLRFITCLWGTSGTNVYSGGVTSSDGEGGFVRRYDGSGWRDEIIDAEAPIHGLWGDGRGNVFAVGGSRGIGGVIYRFDGRSWQEAWRQPEESLNQGLRGLWAGPDGHAVAVGDGGRVIRYDGASWSALDSGAPADYRGVWGADGRLFVVGENGVVRHFDGDRWEDPLQRQPETASERRLGISGSGRPGTGSPCGRGGQRHDPFLPRRRLGSGRKRHDGGSQGRVRHLGIRHHGRRHRRDPPPL